MGAASQVERDPWLDRLRGNEPERGRAIDELRDLLLRGLSKSLNARYGVPFQAEDVVQDALLKILNSLDRFEGRSRFLTWAMTIATRVGISALRREHSRTVSLDALADDDRWRLEFADSGRLSGQQLLDRKQILQQLESMIETELSPRQRLAIRAVLQDVAVDELARRLDSNRNAVYKLIHDARLKLRRGLERQGITMDEVDSLTVEGQ
jgi:RNA polymerase sigma-70 factor (ECF subfamily)